MAELTYPQIACLAHKGKPPRVGRKVFRTMAEAEENRQKELKGES